MWRRAASSVELQLGLSGLLDCWILGSRDRQICIGTTASWSRARSPEAMQVPLGKRLFARLFSTSPLPPGAMNNFDRIRGKETVFSTPGVFW